MVKTKLSKENAKDKLAKYNRPQNCENLVSTRVNPQIWAKMRSSSKSRDFRMQKIESSMLKAKFRRRTSHEPNRMQMRENKGFCSFAFDSAHVKYGV